MSRQLISRANQTFNGRATFGPYQADKPGSEVHLTYRWRPAGTSFAAAFTAGLAAGATSGTLTGNLAGPTNLFPITFSDGEVLTGLFTNGSTAVKFYPATPSPIGGGYGVSSGGLNPTYTTQAALVNAVTANVTVAGVPPQLAVSNFYSVSASIGLGGFAVLAATVPDVPRNVVGAWTTSSTITVIGTDYYGQVQTEVQTGTAFTGKKAFASITSIQSSAAITLATFGTGSALGLPFRVQSGDWMGALVADAADPGTFVAADITLPATTSTGDVRGTYTTNAALNGAKYICGEFKVMDNTTQVGSFGVTPV